MNKHTFRNTIDKQSEITKRVATYYRVSTGRQFANEASIPSQRKITSSFCEQHNCLIVEEYVEAKTATDDRRPVLCTENFIRVDDVTESPKLAE
ncbi:recombinase family protein [Bradyrhizobium sp. Arg237L]|uniref:recombinase family protein n=1 Tax=Bradyrhizobium sp. Arg237L TaxID=3003352 RepID=UPI00249DCD2E|nr:recombinase family protein [Bradyrhizobium sp. Arg237L]MDI4232483.1 recombinase family protein [Bradyrhizobium sp. Arg237L]